MKLRLRTSAWKQERSIPAPVQQHHGQGKESCPPPRVDKRSWQDVLVGKLTVSGFYRVGWIERESTSSPNELLGCYIREPH